MEQAGCGCTQTTHEVIGGATLSITIRLCGCWRCVSCAQSLRDTYAEASPIDCALSAIIAKSEWPGSAGFARALPLVVSRTEEAGRLGIQARNLGQLDHIAFTTYRTASPGSRKIVIRE